MFNLKNKKSLLVLLLVAITLYYLCSSNTSSYTLSPAPVNGNGNGNDNGNGNGNGLGNGNGNGVSGMDVDSPDPYANASLDNTSINLDLGCAMNSGVGLASSLLPREVASQENFGEFAPTDILKTQNFLDARQQIGWPETAGGSLRNGNQQIRSEYPNPKQAYEWNNSTIPSDAAMQRSLC